MRSGFCAPSELVETSCAVACLLFSLYGLTDGDVAAVYACLKLGLRCSTLSRRLSFFVCLFVGVTFFYLVLMYVCFSFTIKFWFGGIDVWCVSSQLNLVLISLCM